MILYVIYDFVQNQYYGWTQLFSKKIQALNPLLDSTIGVNINYMLHI